MDAIFDPSWGIKATGATVSPRAQDNLVRAATWCVDRGAQGVIAACTEVSVGLSAENFPRVPVIDPLVVAADLAVDLAFGTRDPGEFRVHDAQP